MNKKTVFHNGDDSSLEGIETNNDPCWGSDPVGKRTLLVEVFSQSWDNFTMH